MGGGGLKVYPLFLFVKTIEKVIRLCTVLNIFLVVVVKIGTYYVHFPRIYLSLELREKWPYLQNYHSKKINTVLNLITFSIVFTNKNRGYTLSPPPPIKTTVYLPLIITKVKQVIVRM